MIGIVFLSPGAEDKGGEEGTWELAYDLLPAWWGKGVGTGMINAGLGYLEWIGAKKVVAVSLIYIYICIRHHSHENKS